MKRFILKCLFTIFPIMMVIYIYGFYVNFYLMDDIKKAGDLGVLGYFYIEKEQSNSGTKLSENKVDTYYDGIQNKYEILTIGDSFSQQGFAGYQNYLAHNLDKRVLNFPDQRSRGYCPEEIALYLLHNDIYDKLGCKTVIIETVEREFIQHVLSFRDITQIGYTIENEAIKTKNITSKSKREDYLITTFKYFKLYLFKSKNPVKKAQLKNNYFTPSPHNILYFYSDDLRKLSATNEEINIVLERLKGLHKQFEDKGIQLFYLIAPDKYDVYQPYILDNPYQPKTIIDQLEANNINEIDWFINPRNEFRNMISNGIKDVYHIDDTHWSTVASETVGNIIAYKIQSEYDEKFKDDLYHE